MQATFYLAAAYSAPNSQFFCSSVRPHPKQPSGLAAVSHRRGYSAIRALRRGSGLTRQLLYSAHSRCVEHQGRWMWMRRGMAGRGYEIVIVWQAECERSWLWAWGI